MGVTFELPSVLQPYAHGHAVVAVDGATCVTVSEALAALAAHTPGVVDRVLDERGELRPHVNLFVDDENVRFREGLETPVADGSTIVILAAVSGG